MDIKFIAADMDGTLLDEDGCLPAEFFTTYQQLADKGILFSAASGRQYYSLMDTFAPVKDSMIFIAENGTLVMHQGQELYSCAIEMKDIHSMIDTARTIENAYIVICGKNSAYIETQDEQAIAEIGKYYHRCQYVEDLKSVDDTFIKVAIGHFDGTEEHVYPTMAKGFAKTHQVVVSAKIWLDLMNPLASKGVAIKHLQQTLGFTADQSMAFGDYLNDIEMLEATTYSYAMENAHPEVKKTARFSAPDHNQAGVIQVIKEQLLKD